MPAAHKTLPLPCKVLVVIHKYLRDTVILAGMPESSHMDVKARPPYL
jgi:hypothetical protein